MNFVCKEFGKGTARVVLLYPMSGFRGLKQLEVGTPRTRESTSKMVSSFILPVLIPGWLKEGTINWKTCMVVSR